MLGDESLRQRTYVQAHGTGTPQNRVTESHILNELAKTFGIERWTVAAIKSYLGHTIAPASADQLAVSLGVWNTGWIPGITSIDSVAEDVHKSHLHFPLEHQQVDPTQIDATLLNSKGFGGNNATASIISPTLTAKMLTQRHGAAAMKAHQKANEAVAANALAYDEQMMEETMAPIYQFGEGVIQGEELELSPTNIGVPGFGQSIDLNLDNPYEDMFEP